MSFSSFGLHPALLDSVAALGFTTPTSIQKMAIPALLEGRDVLASAVTGSGKTAAFLLPILHRLITANRPGIKVLVLAPTRELAAQIKEHFDGLAGRTRIRAAAIFGGVAMGPQERAFRSGVDVLVATPGRLLDHLQYDYARLSGVEYLVLDEADRMLDMGFLPDIRRVLSHLPKKRNTFFFSATLPAPIVELSRDMLNNPVSLNVARPAQTASGVRQTIFPVSSELKSELLLSLLNRKDHPSVLCFTRTKHRANRLQMFLDKAGVPCERIHGNRSQPQRTEALAGFKAGRYRVLVATDIAARGIDIEALGLVVNFDVPHIPEDYIHRVGRTARAELTGDAYTFVAPDEEDDLRAIERALGKRVPRETFPGFDYAMRPAERFEIPIGERIAAIRARKSDDRARAAAKLARKNGTPVPAPRASAPRDASPRSGGSRPASPRTGSPRGQGYRPASPRGGLPESGPGWSFRPAECRDDDRPRRSDRPHRSDGRGSRRN